jgi:hypothetical protein
VDARSSFLVFVLMIMIMTMSVECESSPSCIPQTGQEVCFGEEGNVPCAKTGQDGDTKAGMPWPENRFLDHEDGTITDGLTGLMWIKNDDFMKRETNWEEAFGAVEALNKIKAYGYNDWRLPNINELRSLINYSQTHNDEWFERQGLSGIRNGYYWSSTTLAGNPFAAWVIQMHGGWMRTYNKYDHCLTMAVRSDSCPSIVEPLSTGQKKTYIHNDDGDLQKGRQWAEDRFIAKGDCVTDTVTGLMWSKDANLARRKLDWQDALKFTIKAKNNMNSIP